MTNATTWIENNPNTGETKPWEVWFHAEGGKAYRTSSSTTEESAKKSQDKLVKRNNEFYSLSVL